MCLQSIVCQSQSHTRTRIMGRKKKFIEKGEGVKFYLVHRSQKDPMYLDEVQGERVLVPADPETSRELIEAVNGLTLGGGGQRTQEEREERRRKQLEEQQKFGIYYEDDYNYLQHLREVDNEDEEADGGGDEECDLLKVGSVLIKNNKEDDQHQHTDANNNNNSSVSNKPKLQLPSSVFASNFEEEVGYFNQGAPDHDPKINWDPDIVRLLDEDPDIDFDNEENALDDDFFVKANSKETPENDDNDDDDDDDDDDEDDDENEEGNKTRATKQRSGAPNDAFFDRINHLSDDGDDGDDDDDEDKSLREFETKSKFSNYSMTSSVIRRNEGLRLLDDKFEKIFAEYDDDQIGALETEEIEGFREYNDLVLESALAEFEKLNEKRTYKTEMDREKQGKVAKASTLGSLAEHAEENATSQDDETEEEGDDDDEDTLTESDGDDDDDDENAYDVVKVSKRKDKDDRLDCESIVSTYSNLYNRPAVISEKRVAATGQIQLSRKTGLPLGVLEEKPKSQKMLERIDHKIVRVLPQVTPRTPNETKEEKKARKQAVKVRRHRHI